MITKTIAESVSRALQSITDASRAVNSDTSLGGVLMGDLAVSPIMTAFDNAALFVNEGVQHLSGAQGKLGAALLEHPTFTRDLSADASTLTALADRGPDIRSAVSQPWASGLREQTRAEVATTLQPITDRLMQLQKWTA